MKSALHIRACTITLIGALVFAVTADGQAQSDHGLELLGRIRQHLKPSVSALPNYTCLETIERSINHPAGRPEFFEKLRLQVLVADQGELFAWPDSAEFTAANLDEWISAGTLSTGNFGSMIQNVLSSSGLAMSYHGVETQNGRSAHRFDFRAPLLSSRQMVTVGGRSGRIAYSGSFWVDTDSLDILRLQWNAEDIPPDLDCREVRNAVVFGASKVGAGDRLVPSTAEMVIIDRQGRVAKNSITFSSCRQFTAQTSISFGTDLPAEVSRPAQPVLRLTPGARLVIRTEQPISGTDSAAGDRISGRLEAATDAGDVTLQKGARIVGRLRRLEHHFQRSSTFMVGIEFFLAETANGPVSFSAHLTGPRATPDIVVNAGRMPRIQKGTPGLDIHDEGATTGVGIFRIHERKLDIRSGFRTIWETH